MRSFYLDVNVFVLIVVLYGDCLSACAHVTLSSLCCADMILTLLNDKRLGATLQEAMNEEDSEEVE